MVCNDLISDAEIEAIYKDDEMIASNQVFGNCIDNDTKKAFVEVYDKDNITLLQKAIERSYFRDKALFSKESQNGKVVKHEYFILKDEHQSKGIAKKIHEKELESYRRNGFNEIQLDAAWDGLVVWKKLFYKFANSTHENFIKVAIQRYLREVKNMSIEEIEKTIKSNPFSINPGYLKDTANPNNDFRHWISRISNKQIVLKMYKEVA